MLYRRPEIDIERWFVSFDDLRVFFRFIKERFPENKFKHISVEAVTESGNNPNDVDIEKLIREIRTRIKAKDRLLAIKVEADFSGHFLDKKDENFGTYKKLSLYISFKEAGYSQISLSASGTNKNLSDWVDGTYEGLKNLKKRFKNEKNTKKKVIFDPYGKFEKNKNEQRKKSGGQNSKIIIRGDVISNVHNGVGDNVGREKTSVENIDKKEEKWWENSIVQGIALVSGIGSIVAILYAFLNQN